MSLLGRSAPLGGTGINLPAVGFGTGSIGNRRRARTELESIRLVEDAYETGFRYYDTAPMYGHGLAERRLGAAVHDLAASDLLVSTKVGRLLTPSERAAIDAGIWVDIPAFRPQYDYSYDGAMRSIEASMQRMLVDHFDLVYIHDPDHFTHHDRQPEVFAVAMAGARRALLELKEQGVVSAVGLGVNDTDVCVSALEHGGFDAFLLARRYTLLEQDPLDDLLPRCAEEGVAIVVGGTFASGILATGTRAATAYIEERPADNDEIARVRAFEEVAERYGVSIAAAAVQFPLAHPAVACVLLGIGSQQQLQQNIGYTQAVIPDEFWSELKERDLVRLDAPTPTAPALLPGQN